MNDKIDIVFERFGYKREVPPTLDQSIAAFNELGRADEVQVEHTYKICNY